MPVIDGFELTARLLPVALSGHGQPNDRARCLQVSIATG
ncbi:hypothetical protein RCH14_003153 [Massilia sp. MP_M2]